MSHDMIWFSVERFFISHRGTIPWLSPHNPSSVFCDIPTVRGCTSSVDRTLFNNLPLHLLSRRSATPIKRTSHISPLSLAPCRRNTVMEMIAYLQILSIAKIPLFKASKITHPYFCFSPTCGTVPIDTLFRRTIWSNLLFFFLFYSYSLHSISFSGDAQLEKRKKKI